MKEQFSIAYFHAVATVCAQLATGTSQGLRESKRILNADLLRHYDRVLKFRKSALAEARDHKCSVCQVMLRPQTYNDVRTNEQIIMCDSCQRILYFVPENEAPPAESANHAQAPAAH